MHKHIRIALASAAAVALTGGLLSLSTGSALAADSVHHHDADFNGDHIGDVAFSAGWATVGGKKGAGQFVALYGSANGLNAATRKTVSQNTTGVPGTAETNDGFGWVSAYGDFNDDGYDDLAVSARYEDVDGDTDGGTVMIMWGSTSGLTGGTTIADPAVSSHDQWGKTLAAGDFDGDGKDDLAVGSTSSTIYVYKGGINSAGTSGGRYTVKPPIMSGGGTGPLNLTAGDVNNDGRTDLVVDGFETTSDYGWNTNYYVPGSAAGLDGSSATELKRGVITGIGDVNGDGFGDIVTGQEWDPSTDGTPSVPESVTGGKVNITYGSATGPATTTAISQDTGNVPGGSERGDDFGGELTLGDINGDGYQDLAVGAPGENLGGVVNTGSVTVLYGSANGIDTSTGGQFFAQSTTGVPGTDEKDDQFGNEVKLTDVNGDGKSDLTVGALGENDYNGALIYLPSSGTKITTTGARSLSATSVGVSTDGYPELGGNAAN
ncbi:FG-GAP and VCBS repeat-containing protein [Streptomyces sp. NPDC005480]|uniref:FG-GAP and VCBS repeat-containing protein n=1 Tax=Streptomyces sp. NPDC005480 TaxID=3154880 RepID=UPI00339ED845